jgi:hypothetical protein
MLNKKIARKINKNKNLKLTEKDQNKLANIY